MSKPGEALLQELIKGTKAQRAATFALLGHLRDIAKVSKNGRARGGALKAPRFPGTCPSCGQTFTDFELELHHVFRCDVSDDWSWGEHCPCKYCSPVEECECAYCTWPYDEREGIPEGEIGTPGDLLDG